MTISPIASVTATPLVFPARPYQALASVGAAADAPPAEGATAAQAAEGSDYILYGESGLVIQSYGAIALISPAALLYANAARPPTEPRPLVPPVTAASPVTRVPFERGADAPV